MTYLENGTHSKKPGPAGSITWISATMSYALNNLKVPKDKSFMGVGLFGLSWKENPDGSVISEHTDLSFNYIQEVMKKYHTQPTWDSKSETPTLTFKDENGKHIIWFENDQSVEKKLILAKKLGVRGVAFWRLGDEDQEIWKTLK
jgi:spore germination protein